MEHPAEEPRRVLVSIHEAARVLGVGRTTLYGLLKNGKIESVKIGMRNLVVAESLAAYVESLRGAPDGDPPWTEL
jgi:excisionase family DNA binding protein